MKLLHWVCVLGAMALLIGCGGGAATPEATFNSFKSVMSDKDYEAAWEMLSKESQQMLDKWAKEKAEEVKTAEGPAKVDLENRAKLLGKELKDLEKMDGKALFVDLLKETSAMSKDAWQKMSRGEFSRAEEGWGRAEVYVKVDDKEEPAPTMSLVLEDAKWKVDFTGIKKSPTK